MVSCREGCQSNPNGSLIGQGRYSWANGGHPPKCYLSYEAVHRTHRGIAEVNANGLPRVSSMRGKVMHLGRVASDHLFSRWTGATTMKETPAGICLPVVKLRSWFNAVGGPPGRNASQELASSGCSTKSPWMATFGRTPSYEGFSCSRQASLPNLPEQYWTSIDSLEGLLRVVLDSVDKVANRPLWS
jgi:hypothetical protein